MKLIRKLLALFRKTNVNIDKSEYKYLKLNSKGKLKRGTVRHDGMMFWCYMVTKSGHKRELWKTKEEFNKSFIKNRISVDSYRLKAIEKTK